MKPISRRAGLLLLGMLPLLSGCSGLSDARYTFSEEWREGRVVQMVSGPAIPRPAFWQCSRAATPDSPSKARCVLVAYSRFGRARQRLVAAPVDLQLGENQTVYVNLTRCEDAVARR